MEVTEKYIHLPAGLNRDCPENGDVLISVDVATPKLLPEAVSHLARFVQLRIDHHRTDTPFAPLELVDTGAGACGEIIYDLLQELGVEPDKAIAEALYTAVATDTGCFRYANTTEHSFLVAAACARAGGDLHGINQAVFETNSFSRLRLQSWMVEHVRFLKEGTGAVCALPMSLESRLGLREDDMENISGFLRTIEGVRVAATLRQTGENRVKLSVRAVPGYDAAWVCAEFGGGGHKGAAGATLALPLDEAEKAVASRIEKLLEQ